MKPHLDMDRIARGLRAERKGKVSAGGGYFGAMQLLAEIETRFRVPVGGGRATDPEWTEPRLVPLAPRTLKRLTSSPTRPVELAAGWKSCPKYVYRFRTALATQRAVLPPNPAERQRMRGAARSGGGNHPVAEIVPNTQPSSSASRPAPTVRNASSRRNLTALDIG
jgi:hypothetical protein